MELDILLELPHWQFVVFAAVFGAMWGSFANVVILRWPLEQSVVRPASHCMACEKPIAFYDNIPIISYILLRGKCRHCKTGFSPRYALVELSMALLSVGVLNLTLLAEPPSFLFGLTAFFAWFSFVFALVTVGMIDLDTFLIPDVIVLPGIGVGIAVNTFVYRLGWIDPLVAAAGSYAGLSLLFVHGYKRITGRQGMGEGDPKLLAMIGAFLLLEGALFTLFAAALQGLIVGTILVLYRRRTGSGPEVPLHADELDEEGNPLEPDDHRFRRAKVPFGPFLALGAIEYYFFGQHLIGAYTDLLSRVISALM